MTCKMCGGKGSKVLLDVTGIEDTYLKLIGMQYDGTFKGYFECPKCEIAYRNKYLTNEEKARLYEKFRDEGFRKESLSEYFRRVINYNQSESENNEKLVWLANFIENSGHHLDVGGGVGVFSYAFKKHFPAWSSLVIEPTPGLDVIESEYGVNIHCGYIDDGLVNNLEFQNKFNLLTMNHVLEHVDNPIELLKLCKTILSTNGMIYVETPSVKDINFLPKDHDRFMSQHEVIFSENGLLNILKKSGLKIIKSETFLSKRGRNNVRVLAKHK